MTAKEVMDEINKKPKGKYKATRSHYKGHNYASRIEAKRAEELDVLIDAGKIYFWIAQPKFFLVRGFDYVADFLVVGYHNTMWAEDVKGAITQRFRDSKRLWAAHGTIPLHIKTMKNNRWKTEIVVPEQIK